MPTITAAAAAQLFRDAPIKFLNAGSGSSDGQVAYRKVGTGPDVLFVHGWPVSGATFRCLLPYLADHVTCHLIDLPGAGSSRFSSSEPLSFDHHIAAVRNVAEQLEVESLAVVGHNSGGLIARHAFAGHPLLRAMGLINTEQPSGLSWRFRAFLAPRSLPGIGAVFGYVCGSPRVRRNKWFFGDAFADRGHLDGEFEEFFLRPLHDSVTHRDAAVRILRAFDTRLVKELGEVHSRIDVPVQLVWGDSDPFFPIDQARAMIATFPNAQLSTIEGGALFVHEERPEEVAAALLPVLMG